MCLMRINCQLQIYRGGSIKLRCIVSFATNQKSLCKWKHRLKSVYCTCVYQQNMSLCLGDNLFHSVFAADYTYTLFFSFFFFSFAQRCHVSSMVMTFQPPFRLSYNPCFHGYSPYSLQRDVLWLLLRVHIETVGGNWKKPKCTSVVTPNMDPQK